MGDQDDTPRRPGAKHRAQTATERDMESLRAKRERDGRRTPAQGVPSRPQMATDQIGQLAIAIEGVVVDTAVPEEIDFESLSGVTETMLEDPDKKALVEMVARERIRRGDAILRLAAASPAPEQMSKLEKTVRRWRALIIGIAVPTITAAVFVFRNLAEKAATDERARIELELVREHDRDYEQRLRQLEAVTPRYLFTPGPTRPDAPPSRKEPSP